MRKKNNGNVNSKLKKSISTAFYITFIAIITEAMTELTGFRKSELYPESKSLAEVIARWPFFLFLGGVTFLIVFCWQYFRGKTQ